MNSIPSITSMGDSLMKTAKSTTKTLTDLTGVPSVGGRSHRRRKSSRKTKRHHRGGKTKAKRQKKRSRKTRTRKYK